MSFIKCVCWPIILFIYMQILALDLKSVSFSRFNVFDRLEQFNES